MKIQVSDGEVLGTYTVGTYPFGVCYDGTNIWVTNTGSANITALKASDGSLVGTYPTGNNPVAACFDGASIWISNSDSDTVTKLRAII